MYRLQHFPLALKQKGPRMQEVGEVRRRNLHGSRTDQKRVKVAKETAIIHHSWTWEGCVCMFP